MTGTSLSPPPAAIQSTDPADEVLAQGSVELLTGGSGSVDSILVNSVEILSAPVNFNTDLPTTASDVAANINAFSSSPNYDAVAVGSVITITAKPGTGSGPNGFTVVSTCTTITKTDTNMSGGTDADEISETVQASHVWDVENIAMTLVADANAANRNTSLVIEDGSGNEIYRQVISNPITASQTAKIFASKWGGSQPTDDTLVHYLTLPNELLLPAGFIIKTETENIQPGDNYDAPIVMVRDYLAGN